MCAAGATSALLEAVVEAVLRGSPRGSLTKEDVAAQLRLMAELVPEWCGNPFPVSPNPEESRYRLAARA